MNANETLPLKDEVYLVVGCALEVINGIGHGLHELQRTIIQKLQPRSLFRIRVYSRPFAVTFMGLQSRELGINARFLRIHSLVLGNGGPKAALKLPHKTLE